MDAKRSFGIALWMACLLAAVPAVVMASDTPMGNVLCTVNLWFTGNTGKGLATIAVVTVGIWKLLGKISGRVAILTGCGIAIIFGAAHLVDAMNAGASVGCAT